MFARITETIRAHAKPLAAFASHLCSPSATLPALAQQQEQTVPVRALRLWSLRLWSSVGSIPSL